MEAWDRILKKAKTCHSKLSWEALFSNNLVEISESNNSKPLQEIFRLLKADSQALQYKKFIFEALLKGSLSSWDLELGQQVYSFCKKINSAKLTIYAAKIYIKNGNPSKARNISNRYLRRVNQSPYETIWLHILVCISYTEENKKNKARRLLSKIDSQLKSTQFEHKKIAEIFNQLAWIYFFLGKHEYSNHLFQKSFMLYIQLKHLPSAYKNLLNATINCGNIYNTTLCSSLQFIEKNKILFDSSYKEIWPQAELLYGLKAFQARNFSEAKIFFKKALEHSPKTNGRYPRLQTLTIITLNHLYAGEYTLAQKYGNLTLELASKDKTKRHKNSYINLKSELLWTEGLYGKSLTIIRASSKKIESKGIATIDELATYNQYLIQNAIIDNQSIAIKCQPNSNLKKQTNYYLDYLFATGQLFLSQAKFSEAREKFNQMYCIAKLAETKYYQALSYLGITQEKLATHHIDNELNQRITQLQAYVATTGETPLKSQLKIALSAYSFQKGNFKEASRLLKSISKSSRTNHHEQFVVKTWLATLEGKTTPLKGIHKAIVARYTRIFFAPKVNLTEKIFKINIHYAVDLNGHPSLLKLLKFLIEQPNYSAEIKEIQEKVWCQSTKQVGWQQKIRNSIKRLRTLFPYTLAPLILHQDKITLFHQAINFTYSNYQKDSEIKRLLTLKPMTTSELALRLETSASTIKRKIKSISYEGRVTCSKKGRNIYYKLET